MAHTIRPKSHLSQQHHQPELPPEVITIIMSKLDDVSALLNCRLVCRSWNAECLSLLRTSKFRKTVGPSDLQKAGQFGTHAGQFILPFRLNQNLDKNYSENEEDYEDRCAAEFKTMGQSVARLMEFCGGSDCIFEYSLDYDVCGAKGLAALNKFLALIAPHLKKVELKFGSSENLSRLETVQILRKAPVLFPQLKELWCETSAENGVEYDQDGKAHHIDDEDELENVESVLIENSHHLEALTLKATTCKYNYWPKNQAPAALKTLKKLDAHKLGNRVQFVENIRATAGRVEPILETLDLSAVFDEEKDDENEFSATGEIFRFFSKTLKSIDLTLSPTFESRSVAFPLRFPSSLPLLEHLGFHLREMRCPSFVNPQEFNFNQETFPVLNSVEIPFGCMLMTPEHPCLPSTTFSTVHKLTFFVEEFTFFDDECVVSVEEGWKCISWEGYDYEDVWQPSCKPELEISPQNYMGLVSEQFPSVINLTVFNTDERTVPENEELKNVMNAILTSELALGIEEFEVTGYDQDYLGNVLRAPDFVNKMTNVKKIRLKSFCDAQIFGDVSSFTLLAQHFVNVQEIEISGTLVAGNEAERLETRRLLVTKFPAWNIKLI